MTNIPYFGYIPYLTAVWIFVCGIYGVVTSKNLVHLVLCLAIVQSSTYVLLAAIGYSAGGAPPIFRESASTERMVDPVIQALMLTDVVVQATVMALLLALAVIAHRRTGTLDPSSLSILRG
jgi:multicomponent Na+:H+ antiporter subunit C